jgi:hypothetical protein
VAVYDEAITVEVCTQKIEPNVDDSAMRVCFLEDEQDHRSVTIDAVFFRDTLLLWANNLGVGH